MPAAPSAGEVLFTKNCKVCHAQGLNGAPIVGNKAMWAGRKDQGLEVLVQHASEGYGLMPAKGGNTELSKEEITLAIEYMLSTLN
ncbi:Cytochrome c5 [Alteromonadaceae bacterium Bs31]|nr:Cytochrome c5 [Alteromonadaceae bacterium Bs31]